MKKNQRICWICLIDNERSQRYRFFFIDHFVLLVRIDRCELERHKTNAELGDVRRNETIRNRK